MSGRDGELLAGENGSPTFVADRGVQGELGLCRRIDRSALLGQQPRPPQSVQQLRVRPRVLRVPACARRRRSERRSRKIAAPRARVRYVQVLAQCTLKQEAVLGHECEPRAEDVEADVRDVPPVDFDASCLEVDDPEQGLEEGALPGAGAANDADLCVKAGLTSQSAREGAMGTNLLSRLDVKCDALEHGRQSRPVCHLNVFERHFPSFGPRSRRVIGRRRVALLGELSIVKNALDCVEVLLVLGVCGNHGSCNHRTSQGPPALHKVEIGMPYRTSE